MSESTLHAVTPTTVEELCRIARLPLAPERGAALAPVIEMLLAGAAALDALDLTDVEPEIVFDARWEKRQEQPS